MNPKVFLYVGVPAMLLTIAGSLSPGWIRVRPTNTAISSTDMGLYYLCSDGACEPYSSAANNYSTYAHEQMGFLELQIEIALSMVIGPLGLILLFIAIRQGSPDKKVLRILGTIGVQASGTLTWIATGKIISYHFKEDRSGTWTTPFVWATPYSLILNGLGGTLALIVALMLHATACQEYRALKMKRQCGAMQQDHPVKSGYPSQEYPNQGYVPST
ncbi:hypothetical protein ScPMuIL_005021 [Solemya velum]